VLPTQEHYNNVRLNSVIGYITPKDMLAGHQQEIQAKRDRKLEAVRQQRKNRRQRAARITCGLPTTRELSRSIR
jgi:putative transposase